MLKVLLKNKRDVKRYFLKAGYVFEGMKRKGYGIISWFKSEIKVNNK